MIGDLLCNEISSVAKPHSVGWHDSAHSSGFAMAFLLVSTVTGSLQEKYSCVDLLAGCFPGGSVIGIPKPRAMEIVAEMERVACEANYDAIGYIGFDDCMDSSIAIRTISMCKKVASYHVGSRVVMNSNPVRECEDSMKNSWALAETLVGNAEQIFSRGNET